MNREDLPHIFLRDTVTQSDFTSRPAQSSKARIPERNRLNHSRSLMRQFKKAWIANEQANENRMAVSLPAKKGKYLEFQSQADSDLVTKSLENIPKGIRLLNVRTKMQDEAEIVIATVYVPEGKEGFFVNRLRQYAEEETPKGEYKNKKLINSIEHVSLALLDSFWQDKTGLLPDSTAKWCQIWLRTGITRELADIDVGHFMGLCDELQVAYQEEVLFFPERAVVLVKANKSGLVEFIRLSDNIAEFRLAKETAEYWTELSPSEQSEWVQDIVGRLRVNPDANVSVAILDHGINNGHELLSPLLADEDCHTHDASWGVEDQDGHGTNMAGIVAYGDLQEHLEHSSHIDINHKLESIKILPPRGDSDPKQWGAITQQAISRVGIQAPEKIHIGCMAVTAPEDIDEEKRGRPSSWSAAIDSLTSGDIDEQQKLFILSAGNVRDDQDFAAYPDSNLTKSVENPGQSWNALTVGAYTIKDQISDPDRKDHEIIARPGELSPYSTTSLTWDKKKWPQKPEIVFEGGNLSKSPDGFIGNLDDLELLTTHHRLTERQFSTIHGTSSATAQAACMAAKLQSSYPDAWPETIRALMIHSAQWTDEMKSQFAISSKSNKTEIANMLRICGYGVPSLKEAVSCANNRLTLIAQETIQPFDKKTGGNYCTKDMHIHALPWPKDVLLGLGDLPIEMKVTLSYFIEPGPGEIGWKDRYRYSSHALRFDVNTPTEDSDRFKKRLNYAAKDGQNDGDTSSSGSDRWMIGVNNRKLGSIHSDVWRRGTAAELATCNLIGIYPVIGWWRERPHLGRYNKKSRYSLVVSLCTPEQNIDIYTPVLNQIRISSEIKIK